MSHLHLAEPRAVRGRQPSRPGRHLAILSFGVLALLLLAAGPSLLRAAAPAAPISSGPGRGDGLAQAEVGQQQLRGSTVRVNDQLGAILEEFERNGIGGEEVQLLGTIRGVLGQLSDSDMARVISLLQEAREPGDAGARRGSLLQAFGTQKTVGLKLRQILLEYQRRQELAGMAARLEELAARQHLSMRETYVLANAVAGRKRDWLSENQRISLQLQVSEQGSLRDEVAAVLQRLRAWNDPEDEESTGRATVAMDLPETARLGRELEAILADLGGGRLLSATGRQREVRGLLRRVARNLVGPPDELEALEAAVREIDALVARQESAREATRGLESRSPAVSATADRQAELVDDTDVARAIAADLDNGAGEQMSAAVGRMQEARGVLDDAGSDFRARKPVALTQQELALSRLATARRLLQQRIDSLEKQREAMADPRSNLRQVRDEVAGLLRRQKELKEEAARLETDPPKLRPLAPKQGDLADESGDAAERAALDSEEAARELTEAASQMRRSQKSLGEGRNQPGAQQAAVDALAKALEALDRKLAELEAAEKELAALEELMKRLIALIEAQQGLNDEAARMARKLPGRPTAVVARAQADLSGETRRVEADVPPSVPQAATYLGDAATQMILAENELGSGRAGEARPAQDEALANLQRAKRELEERMAELESMLGRPGEEASLEKLAEMIREAQKDVTSAMSAERMGDMNQSLKKASKQIRPATSGRLGRMPRILREPLNQADQALTEGSAAAEAEDSSGSQMEAARAQAALAAAAAAIDLAMAGMGQQPGEGQGQGGEGQQQGQGQGKGRGRQPGSQAGKGTGDAGNFFGQGGADGPRRSATGSSRFIGLPARERAALLQSQGERYPQEYAPMIEQYLKNLSDQTTDAPK